MNIHKNARLTPKILTAAPYRQGAKLSASIRAMSAALGTHKTPATMFVKKRKKLDRAMDTNQKLDSCCSRHIAAAGDENADCLLEQVRRQHLFPA